MLFSRNLSILSVVVAMALSVLPSPTHAYKEPTHRDLWDCSFVDKYVPEECQVIREENLPSVYDDATNCVATKCFDQMEEFMPQVEDFFSESKTDNVKQCADVSKFMKGVSRTCGRCIHPLVSLITCMATYGDINTQT